MRDKSGHPQSTVNVLVIPPFVPSRCPPWVLECFRLEGQHALAFSLSPRRLPYLKESAAKKCKFNTSPVKKSRSAFTRATAHDVLGLSVFHREAIFTHAQDHRKLQALKLINNFDAAEPVVMKGQINNSAVYSLIINYMSVAPIFSTLKH